MLNFFWFDNLVPYYKFSQKVLNSDNIFFVWGVVRDIFLNIKTDKFEDIDIAMPWDPQDIYKNIDKDAWSIFKTDKFWTITIVNKDINCQFEITPFRKEGQYLDNRHPEEIKWVDDLISDSKRRDFTINSLYYKYYQPYENSNEFKLENILDYDTDEEKFLKALKKWYVLIESKDNLPILVVQDEELISQIALNKINFNKNLHIILDPQKWIDDLLKQKIKAVGNPDDRIQEDALRIIRWIRFISLLNEKPLINFDFDWKTWAGMKKYYFLLRNVAKERVVQEMKKVFKKWNAFWFIALMDELNILKFYFPSLYLCKNNHQPTRYHPFATYSHSILTLYHLQKISKNYLVRFWMLYHDVWKPDQYYWVSIKKDCNSLDEVYKLPVVHWEIWSCYAKEDFSKLWFSKKEVEEIVFYVKYHMIPWELLNMGKNKRRKEIKKFISEYWVERLLNLCDITIWDRLWQYNPLQHSNIEVVYRLKEEIKEIYSETWRITLKDLKINWHDILQIVWRPSRIVWQILNKLLELVVNWELENKKDILLKKADKLYKSLNNKNF